MHFYQNYSEVINESTLDNIFLLQKIFYRLLSNNSTTILKDYIFLYRHYFIHLFIKKNQVTLVPRILLIAVYL